MTLNPKLDPSCVLCLPWGEPSGSTAYDQSQYGNNGTIYGAVRTNGKPRWALSFDGVDDYAIIEPFTVYGWSGISICRWVILPSYKPNTSWSKSFMIGDYGTDKPCFFHAYPNTETVSGVSMYFVTRKADGTGATYSWRVTVLDKWVFLVDAFDLASRVRKGYLNGALTYSVTIPSTEKTILEWNPDTATYPFLYKRFVIGASVWFAEFVNEVAGEVRIYNRALSDTEIYELYVYGIERLRAPRFPEYRRQLRRRLWGF
jgi:hypothetical protein